MQKRDVLLILSLLGILTCRQCWNWYFVPLHFIHFLHISNHPSFAAISSKVSWGLVWELLLSLDTVRLNLLGLVHNWYFMFITSVSGNIFEDLQRHRWICFLSKCINGGIPLKLVIFFQVLSECSKAEQWLRDRSQQQEALPRNVDPVLWSHEIVKKTEELDL